MKINAESYGHAVILIPKGELTDDSLDALKQAVEHNLKGKEVVDIVLNMESVPFVDSAVLEYMLDLRDQLAERLGQVKLAKCDGNVQKILQLTRLQSSFECYDDLALAVKATQD